MQPNKFNVLMDLQWGSTGKGKFFPWLTRLYSCRAISGSNRPNAGHTVQENGMKTVFKVLPSASLEESVRQIFLSSGSGFRQHQLQMEMAAVKARVCIHRAASRIMSRHIDAEATMTNGSTKQGAGASLVEKIMRASPLLYEDTHHFNIELQSSLRNGGVFHECAQGWDLSLDHGTSYPHVTSRNCGVAAALDQMGASPRWLGDVFGLLRAHPIRVGNDGSHSSGPCHSDQREINWDSLLVDPQTELTTVTKRVRRVFTFSMEQVRAAVTMNGVNKLLVNFIQYLDPIDAGNRGRVLRSSKNQAFVQRLEDELNIPVVAVGTGADMQDVVSFL